MRALTLALSLVAALVAPTTATAAVSAGGTSWVWANPLPQGEDAEAVASRGLTGSRSARTA